MKKTILALFLLAFAAQAALADKKAEDIISKHLEARGGKNAFDKFNSLKVVGTAFNPMTSNEVPYIYYYKKPDKFRIEVTVKGETMVQACDGKKGWIKGEIYGAKTPMEVPDASMKEFKKQADMFAGGFSDWKQKGMKLKYEGDGELDKEKTYKINVEEPSGNEYLVHISQLSYLVLKQEIKQKTPTGAVLNLELVPQKYKEINGMMVPQEIITYANNTKMGHMKFKRFDVNKPIKDDIFNIPKSKAKK